MSYRTLPVINRVGVSRGWEQGHFPYLRREYAHDFVFWYKMYIYIQFLLQRMNLELLNYELKITNHGILMLYLNIQQPYRRSQSVKKLFKRRKIQFKYRQYRLRILGFETVRRHFYFLLLNNSDKSFMYKKVFSNCFSLTKKDIQNYSLQILFKKIQRLRKRGCLTTLLRFFKLAFQPTKKHLAFYKNMFVENKFQRSGIISHRLIKMRQNLLKAKWFTKKRICLKKTLRITNKRYWSNKNKKKFSLKNKQKRIKAMQLQKYLTTIPLIKKSILNKRVNTRNIFWTKMYFPIKLIKFSQKYLQKNLRKKLIRRQIRKNTIINITFGPFAKVKRHFKKSLQRIVLNKKKIKFKKDNKLILRNHTKRKKNKKILNYKKKQQNQNFLRNKIKYVRKVLLLLKIKAKKCNIFYKKPKLLKLLIRNLIQNKNLVLFSYVINNFFLHKHYNNFNNLRTSKISKYKNYLLLFLMHSKNKKFPYPGHPQYLPRRRWIFWKKNFNRWKNQKINLIQYYTNLYNDKRIFKKPLFNRKLKVFTKKVKNWRVNPKTFKRYAKEYENHKVTTLKMDTSLWFFKYELILKKILFNFFKIKILVKFVQNLHKLISTERMLWKLEHTHKYSYKKYRNFHFYIYILRPFFALYRQGNITKVTNRIRFYLERIKRKHTYALQAMTSLFRNLKPGYMLYFRLEVNGKVNYRTRTRSFVIAQGGIPLNRFNTQMDYSQAVANAKAGTFSIKLTTLNIKTQDVVNKM